MPTAQTSHMASGISIKQSTRWRWPFAREPARVPIAGPVSAIALLAGVCTCLWLPVLPAWPLLTMSLLVGIVMTMRDGWLRIAGIFVFGFAFAGLHVAHALHQRIPSALEGKALQLSGRIVELPVHEPRRTRFEFVVDDDAAQPQALRDRRLRIAWYEDDPQARAGLVAGSRWHLPVQLRAPQSLRNPGGSDGEKHAMAARIAATGYVLEPALARRLVPASGIQAWRERMSARIAAAVPSASSRFIRALALGATACPWRTGGISWLAGYLAARNAKLAGKRS